MNRFFKTIKSLWSGYWEARRRKEELAQNEIINHMFNVVERNGNLYIVCNSNAVEKIEDGVTAKEIVQKVKTSRQSNKDYKQVKSSENDTK